MSIENPSQKPLHEVRSDAFLDLAEKEYDKEENGKGIDIDKFKEKATNIAIEEAKKREEL